jgi:hypothetical protein
MSASVRTIDQPTGYRLPAFSRRALCTRENLSRRSAILAAKEPLNQRKPEPDFIFTAMKIESIPFNAFQSLTSCTHALSDPENNGCAWFATIDRRVAGRIYLDPKHDAFRISVLHFARAGWDVREPCNLYGRFEDAEAALLDAMRAESGGRAVTVKDVPLRLKYGKGRKRGQVDPA